MKYIAILLVTLLALSATKHLHHNKHHFNNKHFNLIQAKEGQVDLAIGASVTSSATYQSQDIQGRPIQAGDKAGRWPGTCWHSTNDNNAYYTIDFPQGQIDTIVVTNRADCCHGRLQEWEVLVDGVQCYYQAQGAGAGEQISIDSCAGQGSQVTVRFASSRSASDAYLQVCGLQVFGTPGDHGECKAVDVGADAQVFTSQTYQSLAIARKPLEGQASGWPGNCWHSVSDQQAFYTLQWQQEQTFRDIIVTNRADCCHERLNNWEILVDGVQCFNSAAKAGKGDNIVVTDCNGISGNEVTIKYNDDRDTWQPYLTLCGVQVFADNEQCEAQSDCAILYTKCDYQGEKTVVCSDMPDVMPEIQSVRVPEGASLTIYNLKNYEGQKATFTESVPCIGGDIDFQFLQSHGIKLEQ